MPWERLKNPIFLGADAFIADVQRNIKADTPLREVPAIQRRPLPKPMAQIFATYDRAEAIFHAYASGGYTLQEIGDHCGLHCSSVSRIVRDRRLAKRKT